MKRCAVYHRVSTLDQRPELARAELARAADARGLEIALDVEETGSGANNDRPGLRRVLEAARRHHVDVVMVWKLDRFGRSALDLLANVRQLGKCGCRFVAVSQGLDISPAGDAISLLLLTMLAAVAEFERDLICERTRLGLERARERGARLGAPVRVDRRLAPEIRQLRAEGLSWSEIAGQLAISSGSARRLATMGGLAARQKSDEDTGARSALS
jgi:putative DNA-invertase from lambdoid prophage Rac